MKDQACTLAKTNVTPAEKLNIIQNLIGNNHKGVCSKTVAYADTTYVR
ncbi:hypothetical protein GCM10007423_54470 [Dyadobacter endophyticus]|uniref:Uncharacterized protein n=1 Tax=Dyadobacter endophyticus TaxID=1749036 RepID=A0ABQ1Z8R7_9BACT|nr:hypothetical protein [Dyadobacter endophyticus]GGH51230.1 hypothetical protein GCM10007423_54470 [Dyadobacter endophyticus]